MNFDFIINDTGWLVCKGISMASIRLSETAGCLTEYSNWSMGVTVFALFGGALIALLMWFEKKKSSG